MSLVAVEKEDTTPLDEIPQGVIVKKGVIKGFHIPEDEGWRLVPEFTRDRDYPFFRTTVDFVLLKVMEYAKLKKDNESDPEKKKAWDKIAYDLDKSELLTRMLEGKTPLECPPPKSFKSHWYEPLEHGEAIPTVVKFSQYKASAGFTAPSTTKRDEWAIIDEYSWEILDRRDDEEQFIVRYHDKAPKFLLRRATDEEKNRILHPRQLRNNEFNHWILIREDD